MSDSGMWIFYIMASYHVIMVYLQTVIPASIAHGEEGLLEGCLETLWILELISPFVQAVFQLSSSSVLTA